MMQEETRVLPDGRAITYRDTIHHHTDTHIDFWDRIKILFHGRLNIHSEIYTADVCHVKGSEAKTYVPPIIKKKARVVGMVSKSDFAGEHP